MSDQIKIVDIYYFTGTGNTLLAVKAMERYFIEHKIEASLQKIENSDPKKIALDHTIGVAFPVAYFSTYRIVWDFINALPQSNGTQIFMLDTLGGFSFGLVGYLKNLLLKKGYKPIGAKEIRMPPNVFYIMNEENINKKISKGNISARSYAFDLINGKSNWKSYGVFSDLAHKCIAKFFLFLINSQFNQVTCKLAVDKARCTKCEVCVTACPVHNIHMVEFPVFDNTCMYCMRCTSVCPEYAIPGIFNYKKRTYRAPGTDKNTNTGY